jgi:hypothetical protein
MVSSAPRVGLERVLQASHDVDAGVYILVSHLRTNLRQTMTGRDERSELRNMKQLVILW